MLCKLYVMNLKNLASTHAALREQKDITKQSIQKRTCKHDINTEFTVRELISILWVNTLATAS